MRNILSLIIILVCTSINAQQLENSLLWKISGRGLKKPSYLFGTIHATCDASLDENVKLAMQNTSQLYLEIDLDAPDVQSSMISEINMKDGKKMSDLISKDDFAIVDKFIQDNIGVPLLTFNTVKPFFVSAMLLPKLLDCPIQSIEEELMKISTEQNEETLGLETIQEQMNVFDTIPYQDQIDELVKTAKDNMEKDKKEFQQLLEIYKSKNINALLETTGKSEELYSKFDDELLLNRNKNWIPRIEKIINIKTTFIGIGAAHLAGENGLIRLLRKQGYKVEAVR